MSILVIAESRGQTAQGYDSMLSVLADDLKHAPGLVLHSTHATEDGWRVIEVWETKAQADAFYACFVAPRLPRDVRPKRTVQVLHNIVLPAVSGDRGL